ncbi:hypothetical protein TPENAI_50143 [Tenacibaculum litopenaei]|uniref:hypothetical protein n=1 Tax=Tenacibaculum litopenaei TaxID=396016 RepID=UPI003892D2F5
MAMYSIANKSGIYEADLEKLLRGQASHSIAAKLHVNEAELQRFLNGEAVYNVAKRLNGIYESDLRTLFNKTRKEVAIGIVIGVLLS